ncbi:MAG: Lin0512 family protein [Deltaproteobacteria bacterium]|nr:Lin0512 family protein [Deltaproteobacteria bacterium]MBW2052503.1 Lin0512 family protein [Deltaproteobacteria bacterium]MBW2141092.1 Lin0512 family protein [Deltaproteobacteria bacterium]MBW2324215.1 Lin0512 family protein [Deltaproteobacteria bacterium]
MDKKRFIVEIGTGIDIHGEDVTEAACRAVKDAVSRSCLCGLAEIVMVENMDQVEVDILVASPRPDEVDLEKVKENVPIGRKTVRAVAGGMVAQGLCVPQFAPDCDQIVVANAAVTVFINK